MNYYYQRYPRDTPPPGAIFPCAVLVTDSWNDFSYQTLWGLVIYRGPNDVILKDSIKILQRDPANPTESFLQTSLPDPLVQLGPDYCSICQSIECYKKLKDAGEEIYTPILTDLRDAATSPEIAAAFKDMRGFSKSLLRFSEAEKAFREAGALFHGETAESSFKFKFKCTVGGALAPHEVSFDFSRHPTGLNRTAVIVGRNGTGKTQFLAQFADAMSGLKAPSFDQFSPRRPSFSRVIAVSYSVFDDFIRPATDLGSDRTFSYKYCGIRSANPRDSEEGAQFLSHRELKERLGIAAGIIVKEARETTWRDILDILLEGSIPTESLTLDNISFFDRLSSGQKILVATMTEIVAHICQQSVILFDEPELHLHPEVLAALARALDRLLRDFDSYSIIATHSALLLQETFSRQVVIFRRSGNIPRVTPLTVESFGENLTTITREVFAVDGEKHNFRAILANLAQNRTAEEVELLFPKGLPLQAEAYLQALKRSSSL